MLSFSGFIPPSLSNVGLFFFTCTFPGVPPRTKRVPKQGWVFFFFQPPFRLSPNTPPPPVGAPPHLPGLLSEYSSLIPPPVLFFLFFFFFSEVLKNSPFMFHWPLFRGAGICYPRRGPLFEAPSFSFPAFCSWPYGLLFILLPFEDFEEATWFFHDPPPIFSKNFSTPNHRAPLFLD